MERIVALPRRIAPPEGYRDLTLALRCECGQQSLRDIQAQALAEIHCCTGLLAPIKVGAGKTLVTYLAPRMLASGAPLLLIPAKLRGKTERDFRALAEHWDAGTSKIRIVSYEKLGHPGGAMLLEALQPDLIIADECHRLKNPKAAVTRRVGRYFDRHPGTHFVGLSGTVTSRSLLDFAHLAEWALGHGAPVPLEIYELEQWSQALDEESRWQDARLHPGALSALEGPEERGIREYLPRARAAYRRRLRETPGVVVSDLREEVAASLVVAEWIPPKSEAIDRALYRLEKTWETPDGNPLILAVDIWRHARELAQGFWYRWDPAPPEQWLAARRAWAATARARLAHTPGLDTEAQIRERLAGHPDLVAWEMVRDSYTYSLVPEWFDESVVQAAAAWTKENQGILWVEHTAVGIQLGESGLPYYGSRGLWRGRPIEEAQGGICASIAANSEGRNLQKWSKNLVLSIPTTGDGWEQLIGRTHRFGQTADEVSVEVYLGCQQGRSGFRQALSDARYAADVLGSSQKLLIATIGEIS